MENLIEQAQAYFSDPNDAADAVQEAWVMALERNLDPESCLNEAIQLVNQKRSSVHRNEQQVDPITWSFRVGLSDPDPGEPIPDKPIDMEMFEDLMDLLPPKWERAMQLFYFNKMSHDQIAIEMNVTSKAVEHYLEKGRKKLAELIDLWVGPEVLHKRKKKSGRPSKKDKPVYVDDF